MSFIYYNTRVNNIILHHIITFYFIFIFICFFLSVVAIIDFSNIHLATILSSRLSEGLDSLFFIDMFFCTIIIIIPFTQFVKLEHY